MIPMFVGVWWLCQLIANRYYVASEETKKAFKEAVVAAAAATSSRNSCAGEADVVEQAVSLADGGVGDKTPVVPVVSSKAPSPDQRERRCTDFLDRLSLFLHYSF